MSAVHELQRVLTSKGYAITKSSLDSLTTNQLRSQLTMTPKVQDTFQHCVPSFPIYYESATRYYVPRHWGIAQFGQPEADMVSDGLPLPDSIQFRTTFPPHDFQIDIMKQFIERGANGLICVPCGYGKTFMALHLAVQLRRRFLIVVDKEFLMNQWKAEIANFIDGARVGILQANKVQMDPEKYDVTLCMIQTLCRREFPNGFFDQYGMTIFDECHHLGASYFCHALRKVQTKYMLGLSATPDREDGLTRVFEAFLGPPVYKNTLRSPDKEAVVKAVWFHSADPQYEELPMNARGEVVTAQLMNQVAEYEPRNRRILTLLTEYAADPHRYILVLSDRISQLEWFETALQATRFTHGYYIGGMKQSVLDKNAESCQILLATYQMASEGFSIKRLNTVFLMTPRKNVEQSSGRIFRQRVDERAVAPHIIDIIDSHAMLVRRWYVRQRFYKKCEYSIQHVDRHRATNEEEKEEAFMIRLEDKV